jgi:alpha-D-ribose 1-methylphosphonate 5-triphosphate synthase subunit PhnL
MMLQLKKVTRQFTLHHQHGVQLNVLNNVDMNVSAGECVVLDGPSGMGKSTLLKLIYANYRATSGEIEVRQADGSVLELTKADPRELVRMRQDSVGYVSQFLRVIPRVTALDVVAEPLMEDAERDDESN